MNAAQAASLPLIAFGITEFVLRQGHTAKTFKTTATDRGTTAIIFGSYGIVVVVLCIPKHPVSPCRPRLLGLQSLSQSLDYCCAGGRCLSSGGSTPAH